MKPTLDLLNANDDPKSFGGKCLSDDGTNQLWIFGSKFANRTEILSENGRDIDGVVWDADIDGWNVDGEAID